MTPASATPLAGGFDQAAETPRRKGSGRGELWAVDTSVAVAAFASWHEAHAECFALFAEADDDLAIPEHSYAETYSVLTRLPPPHRTDPMIAGEYLRRRFPSAGLVLPLPSNELRRLLALAPDLGVRGGAVYDAMAAVAARHAEAVLWTRDRRAARVYDRLGVAYEFIA